MGYKLNKIKEYQYQDVDMYDTDDCFDSNNSKCKRFSFEKENFQNKKKYSYKK